MAIKNLREGRIKELDLMEARGLLHSYIEYRSRRNTEAVDSSVGKDRENSLSMYISWSLYRSFRKLHKDVMMYVYKK